MLSAIKPQARFLSQFPDLGISCRLGILENVGLSIFVPRILGKTTLSLLAGKLNRLFEKAGVVRSGLQELEELCQQRNSGDFAEYIGRVAQD